MSDETLDPDGLKTDAQRGLTAVDHAAIMLLLVDDDQAARLLARLNADEIATLGQAMLNLGEIGEPDVERVIDRFVDGVHRLHLQPVDAKLRVRSVMHGALGDARAGSVMARIAPPDVLELLPSLAWMDAADVAKAIADENPQVKAIVLSRLAPHLAAEVLKKVPPDAVPDLLRRIAYLGPVSAAAFEEIESLLARYLRLRSASPEDVQDGVSSVAQIFNALPSSLARSLARDMRRIDKKLAEDIEQALFVFDDLSRMDDRNLGILARSLTPELIVNAFRGGEPTLLNRVLATMSRRAADTLRDQLAESGRIPKDQMIAAQADIVATARSLIDRGELIMGGGQDDYV